MNNKLRATLLTMIAAVVNSGVLSVLTLIYNNLVISHYGSSVNGLVSTLNQFVSLFTILEGGFITAAIVASYEPIVNKNFKKLNDILYTTSRYFNWIGLLFFVLAMGSGLVYLNYIDSPFDKVTTLTLLFITVLTTTLSISVVSRYSIAISGYNKGYIRSIIAVVAKVVTWALSIIFIVNDLHIVWVYLANFLNIILNVVLLRCYELKAYPEVTYKGTYQKELIRGTKDVFFQKIASTIFSSTSLVFISIGVNLAVASVYNLYNQIFHSVFGILISIIESPMNSFGQLLNSKDNKHIESLFRVFLKLTQLASTIFLSAVGAVILSFITIYTRGITDAEYLVPSFAVLLYTQYFCQLNNRPYGLILNAGGLFHMQNIQCGLSTIINLVTTLVFMKVYGVAGVILGAILGTLIILIMNIYQCYKHLIKGNWIKDCLWLVFNYLLGILLMIYPINNVYNFANYLIWALFSCVVFGFIACFTIGINYLLDKQVTSEMIKFVYSRMIKKLSRSVKNENWLSH